VEELMLWIIGFTTLPGNALQVQNVTGTLEACSLTRKQRIMFKISLEDDRLTVALYSTNQQAPGMPAAPLLKTVRR
jgi:hypothetical protein